MVALREPTRIELLGFVSKVRTCASVDTVSAIRAEAAYLLGEPVNRCEYCGHAKLPGDVCPCERFIGQPPNPSSERYKVLT